jgi:hypothetical protein
MCNLVLRHIHLPTHCILAYSLQVLTKRRAIELVRDRTTQQVDEGMAVIAEGLRVVESKRQAAMA